MHSQTHSPFAEPEPSRPAAAEDQESSEVAAIVTESARVEMRKAEERAAIATERETARVESLENTEDEQDQETVEDSCTDSQDSDSRDDEAARDRLRERARRAFPPDFVLSRLMRRDRSRLMQSWVGLSSEGRRALSSALMRADADDVVALCKSTWGNYAVQSLLRHARHVHPHVVKVLVDAAPRIALDNCGSRVLERLLEATDSEEIRADIIKNIVDCDLMPRLCFSRCGNYIYTALFDGGDGRVLLEEAVDGLLARDLYDSWERRQCDEWRLSARLKTARRVFVKICDKDSSLRPVLVDVLRRQLGPTRNFEEFVDDLFANT
jgi:hypothetical protein